MMKYMTHFECFIIPAGELTAYNMESHDSIHQKLLIELQTLFLPSQVLANLNSLSF